MAGGRGQVFDDKWTNNIEGEVKDDDEEVNRNVGEEGTFGRGKYISLWIVKE